jgi:hypothetical protein
MLVYLAMHAMQGAQTVGAVKDAGEGWQVVRHETTGWGNMVRSTDGNKELVSLHAVAASCRFHFGECRQVTQVK